MNNLNFNWLNKPVILFSIFVVLFSSCKKDDVNTDYVGTWSTFVTDSESGEKIQLNDIMIFSESSFTDLTKFYFSAGGQWVNSAKLNGTFTISDNMMTVKVNEIGISTLNQQTGIPTGVIKMYKEGSVEFETLLTQIGQPVSFKSIFSVSGNRMTIMTDINNDNDYSDKSETVVYRK